MTQARRYSPDFINSRMVIFDGGQFIHLPDYRALEKERDELRAGMDFANIALRRYAGKLQDADETVTELRAELDAWHSQFGFQLTHAVCNKETAEKEIEKLRAQIKTLTDGINKWCGDCELRADCIAPNGEPCDLKQAYDTALAAQKVSEK